MNFYDDLVMQTQMNYSRHYPIYASGSTPYQLTDKKPLPYSEQIHRLVQEVKEADAYLDTGNYNREENAFLAQCVGNMLCQRNSIDGNSLAVSQLPQKYAEMEPKQLREYLKSIRTAANQISADMFRFLDAKSHGSRQRDDAR